MTGTNAAPNVRPGRSTRREPDRAAGVAMNIASRYGLVLILLLSVLVFGTLSPSTFLTAGNVGSIASTHAITLILALAVLPALLVGQFDFSVTGTFGVANAIVAYLVLVQGASVYLAIVVASAAGALIGIVNGLAVVRFGVNSLIATLGTGTILAGCANGIAASGTIVAREQLVDGQRVTFGFPDWFLSLGQGRVLGVGTPFLIALAAVVLMWFVLDRTATGRRLVATGGNVTAARLSGVDTDRATFGSFVAGGVVAALAGVIVTAQLGSGQTNIAASFLLPAYAGAYLGATTIRPGRVNAWGTFVGVYLVGVCVAGLQQLGVSAWVQDVFNGAALIVAVGASGQLARLARRGRIGPRRPD
ncbi:ABC transporter permease [Acrocarpospora catenulata]|uniref:ABC transporter permease n=1 Tax=Acrocarpospora catenulata TaxID=2836182 RepID=UPI001BD95AB6|nr:ABC transporter permease [Acrocarpospora catenulata]